MAKKVITNYIVTNGGKWKERYLLPAFRKQMHELEDRMFELNYEPVLVIGKDGMWWNDDICFILDRMTDGECCKGDALYEWVKDIEKNPLKIGETRKMRYKGKNYTVTADTKDLTNEGLMSDNCEPIKEKEGGK